MIRLLLISVCLAILVGCADTITFNLHNLKGRQVTVLEDNPFAPEARLTGIDDLNDALIPNLTAINELFPLSINPNLTAINELFPLSINPNLITSAKSSIEFVQRCDPSMYDIEKQHVLDLARNDPHKRTIPVRYAVSVGTANDSLAYLAHHRSILRVDSNGKTPVYVGRNNHFIYRRHQRGVFHYIVDHNAARQNFIDGSNCFFSTVTIDREVNDELRYKGFYNHNYAIMYYGDYYNLNDPTLAEGLKSPRLFKKLSDMDFSVEDPQIIPLYIADLRNNTINMSGTGVSILNNDFISSARRRREYTIDFKEVFELRNLWSFRDELTQTLSSNHTVGRFSYSAYEGVPQLIDWLVFSGLEAMMMSTQYTPLVLDLGQPHIRTSSVAWGTFFNMANIDSPEPEKYANISHLTAWVGGVLEQVEENNSINTHPWKRRADDGFLVIPNPDGTITSSANLFGSFLEVEVNGSMKTFQNGFDALAALAKKDCNSDDLRDLYLGPWDGELFSDTLKVWVDRNRNGIAEPNEVQGLVDHRIGAINTCFFIADEVQDRFGNSTSHRAAFLLMAEGEAIIDNDEEILERLTTGETSLYEEAEFRVVIDILFGAKPNFILENVTLDQPITQADLLSNEQQRVPRQRGLNWWRGIWGN